MRKRIFQILSILIITIIFGCSSSDSTIEEIDESSEKQSENPETEEEPPAETEESILFSKISYENIIDGNLVAIVEFEFEDNKVVREEGLNSDGVLQNYSTYEYNDKGLLETRIFFNSDDSINFINNFSYDDDNLSLIERIRNNVSVPDTVYNIFTYSNNLIEDEFVTSNGSQIFMTKHFLNDDGFIYKSDNGIISEIILEDELPISKSVFRPSRTDEFEHVYLDSPEPMGPWRNFWKSFYGNLNNQIIVQTGGVISHEDTVDLTKYIVSVGTQLQRNYEFNLDGLPIKIEKTFYSNFQSIWSIEYQD